MKILSVGSFCGISNTCLHRHWAIKRFSDIVDEVNTKTRPLSNWGRCAAHLFFLGLPVRLPEDNSENDKIKNLVSYNSYDVIWIDKGLTIAPSTIYFIKKKLPQCIIVSYSPDNMVLRHNQSQQYIECVPLYDYIVTNKSYIQEDLKKLGARKVLFVNNTFEETFHYPRELTENDFKNYGCDVGFVGTWEKERCESILFLVDHGIKVRIFGKGNWQKYIDYHPNLQIELRTLEGEDYCKALQAAKISLCFLRKINFDQQTTRTVEIPACCGFMLAERTQEHLEMFEEDKEAVFFSSNEELLRKCRYYLCHDEERKKIAEAGLKRCKDSDYSNYGMISRVLTQVMVERK